MNHLTFAHLRVRYPMARLAPAPPWPIGWARVGARDTALAMKRDPEVAGARGQNGSKRHHGRRDCTQPNSLAVSKQGARTLEEMQELLRKPTSTTVGREPNTAPENPNETTDELFQSTWGIVPGRARRR